MRNDFLIGVYGDKLRILNRRVLDPMTHHQARELAAWLIVLSEECDPTEELKPGEIERVVLDLAAKVRSS